MHNFALISDVHLGAFRNSVLRHLVKDSFLKAIDICIERKVDFIIIGGDLFDSNLPELTIVNEVVIKLFEAKQKGIEIYIIYGSHDYSVNQKSIIDILSSAGLFKKITKGKVEGDSLVLEFTTDNKTSAKMVGIDGRKVGLERNSFEILNKDKLEKERGFKIFVFHGTITESKPKDLPMIQSLPLSYFPKNFNYYAGGHLHDYQISDISEYKNIVYPGTTFAGNFTDIEKNAKGQKRGFCIVTFSDDFCNTEFVEIKPCEYDLISYNANGKSSHKVKEDLENLVKNHKVKDKIIIFKVFGKLEIGKASDIDFLKLERTLYEAGAKYILSNSSLLFSKKHKEIRLQSTKDVEYRIFKDRIKEIKTSHIKLKDKAGIELAINLLGQFKSEKRPNETKKEYEKRIFNEILQATELDGVLNKN